MAETAIEWTDKSWNPIRARRWEIQNDGSGKERIGWHCEAVSGGCKFCYAEGINRRLGTGLDYKPGHVKHETRHGDQRGEVEVFLDERMLAAPLSWRKPSMIFPCSMTDLFGAFVHVDVILQVFAVMAMTPHHTYQIVTKRPERMCEIMTLMGRHWHEAARQRYDLAKIIAEESGFKGMIDVDVDWPLRNVWCGTSTEDQATYDERSPWLFETPAAVRFISAEPLLGEIYLRDVFGSSDHRLDWCIVGTESGNNAREPVLWREYLRLLKGECQRAGAALFVKQIPSDRRGRPLKEITQFPADFRVREFPKGAK